MQNNVFPFPTVHSLCPVCGEQSARISYETESFPYGTGEDQVLLHAEVPVIQCDACGAHITDGAAEGIRHSAICHHLGRLAPEEVRAIREQYGLSQADWARQSKIGIASIKRWEAGAQIQNEAMDSYLRLLSIPANFETISSGKISSKSARDFRFRTELPASAYAAAMTFELRKVS